MIIDYSRPETLEEAIQLLQRKSPLTLPLAGGNVLSKPHAQDIAVVDLQSLELNHIRRAGNQVEIGATATLSQIEAYFADPVFTNVLQIQSGKNQRNSGTVGGLFNVADGRSAFLTLLLVLDAQLVWQPGNRTISLETWLPQRQKWQEAQLITQVTLPDAVIGFDSVARTPKDLPIVEVALAKWSTGRKRIAVSGFGPYPVIAFDGMEGDISAAVDHAFCDANDEWASADYRREVGARLAVRLNEELE